VLAFTADGLGATSAGEATGEAPGDAAGEALGERAADGDGTASEGETEGAVVAATGLVGAEVGVAGWLVPLQAVSATRTTGTASATNRCTVY
jgi:hypothetical protein